MGESNCCWNRKPMIHRATMLAAAAVYKGMSFLLSNTAASNLSWWTSRNGEGKGGRGMVLSPHSIFTKAASHTRTRPSPPRLSSEQVAAHHEATNWRLGTPEVTHLYHMEVDFVTLYFQACSVHVIFCPTIFSGVLKSL